MPGRILVIRGGAIGDFLLTLPALHLIRDHLPDCRLEILGYKHIVSLAEKRFYADASRSIEYAPLAGFFGRNAPLDEELTSYFQSFDQIVSYLYDPDALFANNLRRIGIKDFIRGPGKIHDGNHATAQLAEPLQELAMYLDNPSLRFYPGAGDREKAREILGEVRERPLLAIHPGSGGKKKIWPVNSWRLLLEGLMQTFPDLQIVVCGGEADEEILHALRADFGNSERCLWLQHLELPVLGAVLQIIGRFLGHDSGISHLAASAGCRCVLLFGPTDPGVWAPLNSGVRVLRAPGGEMEKFMFAEILEAAQSLAR
jgi:heptosyltransferase III